MAQARQDRVVLRHLLVALLGDDLTPRAAALRSLAREMTPAAWQALPAATDSHGTTLQSVASLDLLSPHLPDVVQRDLRSRALAHRAAAMRCRVGLEGILPLLDEHAGSWALLKGAVLADHIYSSEARRSFADIDLLVAPASVRGLLASLEAAGARLVSRNWEWLTEQNKAELVVQLPNGTVVDLHWGLLGSVDERRGFTFSTHDLLTRSTPVTLRGTPSLSVPALSRADQLLHVAVHAVLSGFGPLRLCLDMDQVSRHNAPDAAELALRCQETGTGLAVGVALERAASVLGRHGATDELIAAATGTGNRSWRRAMRAVDVVNPPPRAHEPIPLQFLTGSTRSTTIRSTRALASFARDKAKLLADPRDFVARLRHGIQIDVMGDVEVHEVDGGARERLLRQLDQS